MSNQFIPASEKINTILRNVIADSFVSLSGCQIHCIMNEKKKISKGGLVLAEIKKPSAIMKYLYGEELDYIIIMDELIEMLSDSDIKRILFNQLCYCDINTDFDDPYKLRGVEFDGFYDELKYNEDDPTWKSRLTETIISLRERQD